MATCSLCNLDHFATADLLYTPAGDLACKPCAVKADAEREAKRRIVVELDPVGGPDFCCAACGSTRGSIVHTGTMRGATVSTTWQCDGCKARVTKRSTLFYVVPLVFVFAFVLALFRVWLRTAQP